MRRKSFARRAVALLAAAALAALLAPLAWADESVESAELADADASAVLDDAVEVYDDADDLAELDAVPDMSLEEFLGRMMVATESLDTSSYSVKSFDSAHASSCKANILSNIISYVKIDDAENLMYGGSGFGTIFSSFVEWSRLGLSAPTHPAPYSDPKGWVTSGNGTKVAASSVDWVAKNVFNCTDADIKAMAKNLPVRYGTGSGAPPVTQAQYLQDGYYYSIAWGIGGPNYGYRVKITNRASSGGFIYVTCVGTRVCPASDPNPTTQYSKTYYAKIAPKTVDGKTIWSLYQLSTSPIKVADVDPNRIAGDDRYETSAAVARKAYPNGCEGAIIATGATFPDALAASSLAGVKGWPILTTEPGSLSAATKSAIKKLGAKRFIIVGGTGAVSSGVAKALKDYGSVERIAGANRYETAEQIYRAGAGSWSKTAIIACGSNYPDALSISGYACKTASPIFLASSGGLESGTKALLRDGGFERVIIVGGNAAVPAGVDKWVRSNLGVSPERLQGADRYATSRAIGEFCTGEGMSADKACIATGANFPDALAGASLVARNNSLMLLAADGCYESFKVLSAHKGSIHELYYLGGKNAVTPAVKAAAKQAAGL